MQDFAAARACVNDWMREHGAQFAVRRQGRRHAAEDPFDPIPRELSGEEFTFLEQGLIQRIHALNQFLNDVYHARMILLDGVIPEEFVFTSPGFRPECVNLTPMKGIYAHISATDLVRTSDGAWYVRGDALTVPEGITYPHFARKLCRERAPEDYDIPDLCDNCGLDILLEQLYQDILDENPQLGDGIAVMLDEGEGSLSEFELRYMASLTGTVAARAEDLIVMDEKLYYRAPGGSFHRVSILHRLTPDASLDPLCFDAETPCGIPHLMEVYSVGNIAVLNALGCAVAEDRRISYFVPDMIRYYLNEEPILPNVPAYLPCYSDQRDYVLQHMDQLVFKDIENPDEGGTIFGDDLDTAGRQMLSARITADPQRFLVQERMDVETLPIFTPDGTAEARCDFRAYTVHSDSIRVWMGGLSRFTVRAADGKPGSGFKDTWVMSD